MRFAGPTLYGNPACLLHDLEEGVLGLELRGPGSHVNRDTVSGLEQAVAVAEREGWSGIVILSRGQDFALGASLQVLADNIARGDWQDLDTRGRAFQQANLALRHCKVPVVAALQGYALGGGCEIALHCDAVVAREDVRMGLVESRAGLLPGAGGTKEMTLRARTSSQLKQYLALLVRGQVSVSAQEAMGFGYLRADRDVLAPMDCDLVTRACQLIQVRKNGYLPDLSSHHRVLAGYAELCEVVRALPGVNRYDRRVGEKIAWVMSGADQPDALLSIETLLDLEREALRSLAGEPRTSARIHHLLKTGLVAEYR